MGILIINTIIYSFIQKSAWKKQKENRINIYLFLFSVLANSFKQLIIIYENVSQRIRKKWFHNKINIATKYIYKKT